MLSNFLRSGSGGIFLSEILIDVPAAIREEYQSIESDNTGAETLDNRVAELDRVLTPLVSANADVIVKCPWLGNDEVPLRDAMIAYPKLMIEEDPHVLAGIVMDLLASRVEETKEAEEDEAEEDKLKEKELAKQKDNEEPEQKSSTKNKQSEQTGNAEAKVQQEQPSTKTANVKQSKIEVDKTEDVEISPSKTEKSSESTDIQVAAPRTGDANSIQNEPAKLSQKSTEAKMAISNTPDNSTQDSIIYEAGLTSNRLQPIENTVEYTESSISDFAAQVITDDAVAFTDEKIEAVTEELMLASSEDTDGFVNLAQENLLIDFKANHFEVDDDPDYLPSFEVDDSEAEETAFQLEIESNLPEPAEIAGPEQIIKDAVAVEEIEGSLIELVELIEISEPEVAHIANEYLDKISEVSVKLNAGDENFTEEEAVEELRELFTGLFDSLGIDYTPELIESLAYRTIERHLNHEELKDEEETDEIPEDSGTHELIRKLLAGSNTIQKAMARACAIGKSALHLYSNRILVEEYLTR